VSKTANYDRTFNANTVSYNAHTATETRKDIGKTIQTHETFLTPDEKKRNNIRLHTIIKGVLSEGDSEDSFIITSENGKIHPFLKQIEYIYGLL
jgi:hypothetical protein